MAPPVVLSVYFLIFFLYSRRQKLLFFCAMTPTKKNFTKNLLEILLASVMFIFLPPMAPVIYSFIVVFFYFLYWCLKIIFFKNKPWTQKRPTPESTVEVLLNLANIATYSHKSTQNLIYRPNVYGRDRNFWQNSTEQGLKNKHI